MPEFITTSSSQTQKLGEKLARKIKGGQIVALEGNLGSGKTTFTQGLLKGLKVKGPYTSPTFTIMKHYRFDSHSSRLDTRKEKKLRVTSYELRDIYHIDAYRIKPKDLLSLGWKEIVADKNNIIIIEWADRVKKIIPKNALWLKFKFIDNNHREIWIKY